MSLLGNEIHPAFAFFEKFRQWNRTRYSTIGRLQVAHQSGARSSCFIQRRRCSDNQVEYRVVDKTGEALDSEMQIPVLDLFFEERYSLQ
jgi:hypothetical protein